VRLKLSPTEASSFAGLAGFGGHHLPMLRPLRALRLVVRLRIFNRSAPRNLLGRVLVYVTAGGFIITFVAALAVLDAERDDPAANITTLKTPTCGPPTNVTTAGYGGHLHCRRHLMRT
jgi:voltage-gated potassium channel